MATKGENKQWQGRPFIHEMGHGTHIHTNSITQPLHVVHTGHILATFNVSIYCVRAGLTSHRALHRAVSTLMVLGKARIVTPLKAARVPGDP